jgi:hypothetical protein
MNILPPMGIAYTPSRAKAISGSINIGLSYPPAYGHGLRSYRQNAVNILISFGGMMKRQHSASAKAAKDTMRPVHKARHSGGNGCHSRSRGRGIVVKLEQPKHLEGD